jgi:type IV secretion system protein VirD4
VAVVLAALVGCHWAGAALAAIATGANSVPSINGALRAIPNLPDRLTDPATAWPQADRSLLPSAIPYWTAMLAVLLSLCALAALVAHQAGARARRHGPDGRGSRFAGRRELGALLVRRPQEGRFVIGRVGRRLVAPAVDRPTPKGRQARGLGGGAIALVGPSRSGKTTTIIDGVLSWTGPAILSSVKTDLHDATVEHRRRSGEVLRFDPAHHVDREQARWSPLLQADDLAGAQRAARHLADAAPRGGVGGDLDFWLAQAEILLTGLLYVARATGKTMDDVSDWVLTQDRPTKHSRGDVRRELDRCVNAKGGSRPGSEKVESTLEAIWKLEARTRSSVYSTASTLIWPWCDPGIARTSVDEPARRVTLDWITAGSNTLYLCSPIEDQRRLAPAFGGLLNDLIGQIYRHNASTGQRLDPPLLVVIDEAGNTPLRLLPEYASTLAGMGVLLVTVWQSLAQIRSEHGSRADTILSNHLTKCFYSGISDPTTLTYLDQLLGNEEVRRTAVSHGGGRPETGYQETWVQRPVAAPSELRQMTPSQCLLLHGTLPPARVRRR